MLPRWEPHRQAVAGEGHARRCEADRGAPAAHGASVRPGRPTNGWARRARPDTDLTGRWHDGRMTARWTLALTATLAAVTGCGGADGGSERTAAAADRAPGTPSAQATDPTLREHLQALQRIASANDGTRAAGTPGDTATADYLVEHLRAAGYRVRTQRVRFPFSDERTPPRVTRTDGPDRRLRVDRDVRTLLYSGPADLEARVRAIEVDPRSASASGCSAGAFGSLQRGEIALLQRGTCTLRRKALNAQ